MKRYEPSWNANEFLGMESTEDGDWVRFSDLDMAFELIKSWRHRADVCDRMADNIEHGEGSVAAVSRITAKAGVFRACAKELEKALNER